VRFVQHYRLRLVGAIQLVSVRLSGEFVGQRSGAPGEAGLRALRLRMRRRARYLNPGWRADKAGANKALLARDIVGQGV